MALVVEFLRQYAFTVFAAGVFLYLATVAVLREQRARSLPVRYQMTKRQDFKNMTADVAQAILKDLTELEFPKLMGFSIVFALFKTYGVPSISSLLVVTGQSSTKDTTSKRTADTGVLLLEFALNKPSSLRSVAAIARMNYLHSQYIKAGKIKNSDLLYTLSVFALEPPRWIDRYEWRSFTDLELCASGTYWKYVGDAMNISMDELPSYKAGWTDGLHWLKEMETWSTKYEERHMVAAKTNNKLALAHLDLMFLNVPNRYKVVCQKFVSVIVGERLRQAMMLPNAPAIYHQTITLLLRSRQLILRYLTFPRPEILRKRYLATYNENTGKYNAQEYLSHPWYVKPSFRRRWGPRALCTRFLGRKVPGDEGNKYKPEGFVVSEVGPDFQRGKGTTNMREDQNRIRDLHQDGCPFSFRG